VCPLEDTHFKELHKLTKATPPAECMQEMNITFWHIQAQLCVDNPKSDWFGVGPGTADNIVTVLQGWRHNPKGVPLLIHGESVGTLNISDTDVWKWLKKLSPKSWPLSASLRAPLISLFSKPGWWINLIDSRECLTPQGDTLRLSIMSPFPIGGHDMSTIPLGELSRWLARCSGLTPDRVPRIGAYVMPLLSKEAYNPTAIKGQQQMKEATTSASKCARTKASPLTVTVNQLDHELASARPTSPPHDPAASVAWHHNNGLALPDHLHTEHGPTTQGARSTIETMPTKPAGAPQTDPWPPLALYTDIPMGDAEDILNWELDPSPEDPWS
jgi:hypothetical protein